MSGFTSTRVELAGKITAAGLPAGWQCSTDPAMLPPFVLVDLVTVDRAAGIGAWGCSVPVKICTPPPGDLASASAMELVLELVLTTLGYAPARPGTIRHGDKDLPGYTLTYPLEVPNPTC